MTQGLQNKTGMCDVARFRKESPWDCHHPCQPPFPNDTSPSFAGNLKRLPKLCHFTTLGFFVGVFSMSLKTRNYKLPKIHNNENSGLNPANN